MTSAARTVFALLVLATFGAFFVTQRLKHTPTAVQRILETPSFSPTPGSRRQEERISFRIKRADSVTVTVVNSSGDEVATLGVRDQRVPPYHQTRYFWNGRLRNGRIAPDGAYRIRVRLRDQGRSVLSPRSFRLDTTPPRPKVLSITPARGGAASAAAPILPLPQGGGVNIAYTVDAGGNPNDTDGGRNPQVLLYRTDVTPARLAATLPVTPGSGTTSWDGTLGGHPAPEGTYLVLVRAQDSVGNAGASASLDGRLPPGRAGITVRYLGVQPPTLPVTAGAQALFGVDARQAPYTWSVQRLGARRPRSRGRATSAILSLRAPAGASGLYLLGVLSRGHSTQVPFAVQGPVHHRVLVVLPAISWLGGDRVDDTGAGVPSTLDAGLSVRRARVFAGGLPAGFGSDVQPVLQHLDAHHLRYDLTTDLALADAPARVLTGHSGVLLPASERWLPGGAQAALRAFVHDGGRVASLGTDSLRRTVTLTPSSVEAPGAQAPADAFGARLAPVTHGAVTITNFQDDPSVNLFAGGNGRYTGFSDYEPTSYVGGGGALLSSAVTADGRAVVVAARYGRGLVVRSGLPALAARIGGDPNSAALVLRMWQLLSGR